VSWSTILYNVALAWSWVATWLAGALCATHYKWGFFAFGTLAYLLLALSLLHTGSLTASRVGLNNHYFFLTGWLVFLWLLYPIAYGLDDGGNKIGVTGGFIFFGILDVLTVPLLAFAILALAPGWDYGALNLYFTQYGRVSQAGTYPEREKAGPARGGVVAPAAV
jgi:bacteriorhodopsin